MAPNVDYIYWTFTAAAQSVAAFIGLLLAGYALVHSLMEAARERDETLDEIYAALRLRFHRWLSMLAALTCMAIVLSLVVVFTNRWEFPGKYVLVGLVGIIDFAAVVCGLAFVVNTSHPSRYMQAAERELAQRKPGLALSGESVPVGKFFATQARLERVLRRVVQASDIAVESNTNGRPPSFRQLAEALLENDRIDAELHRELMEINQYRNLVHHGHVTTADKTMLDRVQVALKKLEPLKGERERERERATA
ncbi:MAG TPA: hypothetical protein VH328_14735 [Burkholderiaceae bacterium]|nr:hypothetical protein [Burkholderiaceae bacterium]